MDRKGKKRINMRLYPSFPFVRMERIGFRTRENGSERDYAKSPAIIFFDWEHDRTCDHVGNVEQCDGITVYTVERNSGDAVKERSYAIDFDSIMGYGTFDTGL